MKTIALLNDTSRETGHIGCEHTVLNILRACNQRGINVTFRDTLINEDFDKNLFLEQISECDGIIVNGEGTLHHNAGIGLYKRISLSKETGKPVYLVNAVWQDNEHTKLHLANFDAVFVRESSSLKSIRIDGASNAKIAGDMIFFTDWPKTPEKDRRGGIVIDSVVLETSALLSRLAAASQTPFAFMGLWHARNFRRRNPGAFLKTFFRTGSLPFVVRDVTNISTKRFVLTGRYHGACFAAACGVPFLATPSNTHKIEGLVIDMGLDPDLYCLSKLNLNFRSARSRIDKITTPENMADYQLKCEAYKSTTKLKIAKMFDFIKTDLNALSQT